VRTSISLKNYLMFYVKATLKAVEHVLPGKGY
jgi:hypothetical protein